MVRIRLLALQGQHTVLQVSSLFLFLLRLRQEGFLLALASGHRSLPGRPRTQHHHPQQLRGQRRQRKDHDGQGRQVQCHLREQRLRPGEAQPQQQRKLKRRDCAVRLQQQEEVLA